MGNKADEAAVEKNTEATNSQTNCKDNIVVSVNNRTNNISAEAVSEIDAFDDSIPETADSDQSKSDETSVDETDEEDNSGEEDIDEVDDFDDDAQSANKLNYKKIGCISCGTVLIILVIMVVSITALFYHYYNLMEIDDDDSIYFNDKVTFSDTEFSEIPDGKVEIDEGDVFKNKDVFNVLLIGTDERTEGFSKNARADSMMILSLNKNKHKIRLVSLERGMLVKIPGHKNDILTHTFRYGGSNLLMETIRTHFKLDVDKYIRVNFSMFQKLVDEVGGVDITLTEEEAYGLNYYKNSKTRQLDRDIQAGINHLNGYEALQYSRLRWIDDDFHRILRQRKVILAIKENLTGLSVEELNDVSNACLPYVQTNLSAMEFASLLVNSPSYLHNDAEQLTIPKKGTYQTLGHVDFKENSKILHEFLYN